MGVPLANSLDIVVKIITTKILVTSRSKKSFSLLYRNVIQFYFVILRSSAIKIPGGGIFNEISYVLLLDFLAGGSSFSGVSVGVTVS